ncbi:unnamed protein product, partial [marine sediment metagenome]
IEVRKGSAVLAAKTDTPHAARSCTQMVVRNTAGRTRTPPQLAVTTTRLQDVRRSMSPGVVVRVKVGQWTRRVEVGEPQAETTQATVESFRATVKRVGGQRPSAMFTSLSEEKTFTLRMTEEMARRLASSLYREVEIVAKATRGKDGAIEEGVLTDFDPVVAGDACEAWSDWFESSSQEWNEVKDIEGELGRNRPKTTT